MGNASKAEGALEKLGSFTGSDKTAGFFDKLSKGALGLGTALIVPMGLATKGAIELEDAVVNVGASLGTIDPGVLDSLSDMFLEVGAASKYSAVEVAGVSDALAKAGYSAEDILGGMAESVVLLSQATGDGLAPATEGMIQAFAMWSEEIVGSTLAMTDAARVADILTIAANQSAGGINDVIAGLTNAGPAMAGVGISFEDAAAAISLFTNYGYTGAEIGTKLSRTLTQLANPTAAAAREMEKYGIVAFDAQGAFIGFPALFDQLQTGFAGVGDEARLSALKIIFGAEAFDLMNIAVSTGGDPLREFMSLMGQSGVAAEQSAMRMGTVSAKLGEMKESLLAFLTSLVTGLLPGFHFAIDAVNSFIDILMGIPDPIKTVIGAVAGLLAGFAAVNTAIAGFSLIAGVLGISGIGAAISAVIPIVLGLAAAAGAVHIAWKTDFGGLRGIVSGVGDAFSGVQNFVNRFLSAFRRVESPVNRVGSAFKKIAAPIEAFANGFQAVAGFIGDVVGPFEAVVGVGERFGNAIDRVVGPVDRFAGGMAAIKDAIVPVSDAVSTLGRIFDSLAIAIEGINGGNIPGWLQTIASGFREAADIADRFFAMFDAGRISALIQGASPFEAFIAGIRTGLRAIDIGGVAIRVGSWLISAAVDVASAIYDWVTGTALPAAGRAVISIGSVALSIGSWIISAAADLWQAIGEWILGNGGGGSGDPTGAAGGRGTGNRTVTLGAVAAEIGGWVISALVDVVEAITDWLPTSPVVSLGSWTLNVGLPSVYFVGWSITEVILNKLDRAVVGLTEWTMQINGADVVDLLFDVGQAIADKIAENPVKAAIAAGAITLALIGAPVIILGAVALYIAMAFIAAIPDSVKIAAGSLAFSLTGFAIELVDLATEIAVAFAAEVGEAVDIASISFNVLAATLSFGFDLVDLVTQKVISLLPSSIDIPFPSLNFFGGTDDLTVEDLGGSGAGGRGMNELPGIANLFQGKITFPEVDFSNLDRAKAALATPIDTSALTSGFQAAKDAIAASMADIGTSITSGLSSAMQTAVIQAQGVLVGQAYATGIGQGITSGSGTVSSAIATLVTTAGNARIGMTVAGLASGWAFGDGTAAGIRSKNGTVGSAAGSYVSTAAGYQFSMMAAGLGIGWALGDGVAAGIRSKVGAVAAEAASLVTTAIAAAKAAAAISSPSRVMRDEVGRMLGLGAALGVESQYGRMASAMAGLVMVPDVPRQYIPDVPNQSTGGGSTVINNVQSPVNVEVHAPQGMSDADEADFVQRFAQAIKTGTDLVYMAQGVSS